jgi:carboxypeptidase Q
VRSPPESPLAWALVRIRSIDRFAEQDKAIVIRRTALLILSACIGSAAWCADASLPPSVAVMGRALDRESRGYALLEEMTTRIGQRMSATDHGAAAEEFVFQKLKQYGFKDVRFDEFPLASWKRGTTELQIGGETIKAAALVYTPAVADVTAEVVDVGNGTSEDYSSDYDKVRGKLALIYSATLPGTPPEVPHLPRWEKLALAVGHGAKGVILINPSEGDYVTTGIAGGSAMQVDVPVVMIGRDSGSRLRERLKSEVRSAHIRIVNVIGPGIARNVVATIQGTKWPDEVVLLGGHLDSLDLATGAVDDGTGSMWVLDVARGLMARGFRPKRSVRFVFFMGEEEGLVGSYSYVRKQIAAGTIGQVRYMINTDMSFDPTQFNLWGGAPNSAFFQSLAGEIHKIDPRFERYATDAAGGSQSTDAQPFIEQGIPVVYAEGAWPKEAGRCVHADCDTIQWVSPEGMKRSAVVGAMLIAALADSDTPVARGFDVAQFYKDENIKPGYRGPAPPK